MVQELEIQLIIYFCITTFAIVMSPGPSALGVCTESINCGYKSSFYFILGIAFANILYFSLSAAGIATLMLQNSLISKVLNYLGFSYLMYIGVMSIFSTSAPFKINPGKIACKTLENIFMKGFIIEILNPKALLYFSIIVPQFIVKDTNAYIQFLVYGSLTFFFDLFCYSIYALFSNKIIHKKTNPQAIKLINLGVGICLIGIAFSLLSSHLFGFEYLLSD